MLSVDLFENANVILEEIKAAPVENAADLEQFRIKYLGSKNIIKPLFGEIRNVPNERKKEFGQLLNTLKQSAETRFKELQKDLASSESNVVDPGLDMTRP